MLHVMTASALVAWGLFFNNSPAPKPQPKAAQISRTVHHPDAHSHHVPAESSQSGAYGQIDSHGLHALISANVDVFVADARPAKYDNGRRIPTARLLPYNASDSEIRRAIPNRSTLIVTYCGNARCPLSEKLAKRLTSMGYENVLKNPDGLRGWTDAGYSLR